MSATIGPSSWCCPLCGDSESVPLGESKMAALGWHVAAEHPLAPALDRLESVRDAHEWGCDCTPDDPCRILIALNGGPSRPEGQS